MVEDREDIIDDFHADYQLSHAARRFFEKVSEYRHVQDDSARNGHTPYGAAFNAMVKVLVERVSFKFEKLLSRLHFYSMVKSAMGCIWLIVDAFVKSSWFLI